MRKGYLLALLACAGFSALLQSCRSDAYLTDPVPVSNQSFVEEFDTVSASLLRGWVVRNTSIPVGGGIWQQGGSPTPFFAPYSSNGTYAGFIGVDYTSTSADMGTISNWLISPVITMQNGDKITFYTRALQYPILTATGTPTGDTTDYGNRLQLLVNTDNEGTEVGSGMEVGSFTTPLLDINPTYIYSGVLAATNNRYAYPKTWTKFEATVFGLNGPKRGRFAFRYLVEDGGSNGNGSGVGIDRVEYTSVSR